MSQTDPKHTKQQPNYPLGHNLNVQTYINSYSLPTIIDFKL